MALTSELKTCLKDINFLQGRLTSMESPFLEMLFSRDKRTLQFLGGYKTSKKRLEKIWDSSLCREIETEDVIWSKWNDGCNSLENRPNFAAPIVKERRIEGFETELNERETRRESLRKGVRKYEVSDVPEAAKRFMNQSSFVKTERNQFDDIFVAENSRGKAGKFIIYTV